MNGTLEFVKMHGIGNDFVLIDGTGRSLSGIDLPELARRACHRKFGIGADGLLLVWPSKRAEFRMQILNPDGSEAEMCGNGIRCFAKYLYDGMKEKKEVLSVETKAGIMVPAIIAENGVVKLVEVDMGPPKDEGEIILEGYTFKKISMGNPHAVTFVDDLALVELDKLGPAIENNSHFPNRTNVEFVRVLEKNEIEVLVWERGAGITLACGTGACASLAAAVLSGRTDRRAVVHLPGGNLDIEWQDSDGHLIMRGPAATVFEGKYYLPDTGKDKI
ncbi:MAG: diaminopimelate epimerase [Candidatus Margulisiibacteriota bacterium]